MTALYVAILVLLANTEALRFVCYYHEMAQRRRCEGKYLPEDIDPTLCTHIVYSYAGLLGLDIKQPTGDDDDTQFKKGMYTRVTEHKERNPNLKVLLAVGGWQLGSEPFVPLVQTPESRKTFAKNAVAYLRKRNFDGLSVDWFYPGARGSSSSDPPKYQLFMETLRKEFEQEANVTSKPSLLLAATVGSQKRRINKVYEHVKLLSVVDFVTIKTYDFHGPWEKKVNLNSPLYANPIETGDASQRNLDWAAKYWVSLGAPKEKLNIGIPTFGQSFTLADSSNHSILSPATGPGNASTFTNKKGFLAYYEVCDFIKNNESNIVDVASQGNRYAFNGDQWIAYEDVASVTQKACYTKKNSFGGMTFLSIDLDDFSGKFCNNGTYPLLRAARDVINSTNTCPET